MVINPNAFFTIEKLAQGTGRDFVYSHSCEGFKEPASESIIALYDESPGGQLFQIFIDSMDIAIGDKMIDENGNEYYVRGVQKYESIVGNHAEIIARLGQ